MTEQEVGRLRRRQMSTQNAPDDQGGERGNTGEHPGRKHCGELGGHERRWTIRQLHKQTERACLLLLPECADGYKRKQEGYCHIERTERGHENTVERR